MPLPYEAVSGAPSRCRICWARVTQPPQMCTAGPATSRPATFSDRPQKEHTRPVVATARFHLLARPR